MIRLNLLPPEMKEQIEFSHKNAKLYQILVRSLAIVFGVFAVMFIVGFVVWNNQLIAFQTRNDAYVQLAKMGQTETEAKEIYTRLNLIDKIRKDRLNWTKIFTEISSCTPTGVRLTGYDFSNAISDRVTFSGFATTSSEIGAYREKLSQSSIFKFVDVESLVGASDPEDGSRSGYTFRITLSLKVPEAKIK